MQQDIDHILTLEIKKEMADRYFGFRKLIEDDIRHYNDQVLASSLSLEQKIGFDLVKLYILLKDETLIHDFFKLTGLRHMIFFDPYLTESPTIRKRAFAGRNLRGLTRSARFKNMIFDTYKALSEHIDEYRAKIVKLEEERKNIAEEIEVFYKKNDLGTMMDFLRSLDGGNAYKSGKMEGGLNLKTNMDIDKKILAQPPPPVDELLPILPQMPRLATIKHPLKKIIEQAYTLQGHLDLKDIVRQ